MDRLALKTYHKAQRQKRVRKKIRGTATVPRISVHKSSMHFYLQAIDDDAGITLASAGTYGKSQSSIKKKSPDRSEQAAEIAARLSRSLSEKKIVRAVYDCNGNKYHGNVKIIAESIRATGIQI